MKFVLFPLLLIAAACSSGPQPNSGQPVGPLKLGDYTTDVGPSPTGVIPAATLHDAQRNKDVDIFIEYPTRGGPFPVIVFSHGYGASKEAYEPLAGYWVSNGYVVIRPSHADANALADLNRDTLRDVYEQASRPQQQQRRNQPRNPQPAQATAGPATPPRPNPMEKIYDKEREPQWRDRVADITLVIDNITELTNRFPELRDKVDASKVAVAGHSYGAFTALMIAGVNMPADPRVKAVLAMSPPGTAANRNLTQQSFANLRVPVMFMTGTEDRGAAEGEDAKWRQQSFDSSPAPDKFFVLLEGARHMTFTGRSAAAFDVVSQTSQSVQRDPYTGRETIQTEQGPNRPSPVFLSDRTLFQRVKILSLIFWDAYLKGQTTARDLLIQDKMPSGVTIMKK